eukprot:gene1784-1814_t
MDGRGEPTEGSGLPLFAGHDVMESSPTERPNVPRLSATVQWQLAAGLLLAVLALFWFLPWLSAALSPPPAPPPPAAADGSFAATDRQWQTLKFATVQSANLDEAASSEGKIAVDDDLTTPVFSPFTGRVTRIEAKAGDRVRAGQVLFAVAASEAAQSQADLATATAQVRLTRAAEARLHDLYDHKGAALKDWQQAQADLATAEAALAAAEGRRKALGGTVEHGEGVVRAPVSGVVTQRLIGPGQNVASAAGGGATQAFVISGFDRVWLVGNLREEDAGRAKVGQIAQVRPLGSDEVLQARISYVAPMIDPASRRLQVRAELPNPDGHLKPETFARFTLLTGATHPALTVPEEAVIFEGQTARVWVASTQGHRLALRQISAGK